MCVSYYTYKVEFQDRGAGHIHGTMWLRLDDLQDMHRGDDGELKPLGKDDKNKNKGVLHGLRQEFTKFRKNIKLDVDDRRVLT